MAPFPSLWPAQFPPSSLAKINMPRKQIPKMETPWSVAVKLAAHFGVAAESASQWFETGCPINFEEGVKWKETRIEEAKLKAPNSAPNNFEKARQQARRAKEEVNWDILSPDFAALVDTICDFFLVGISVRGIEDRLGVSQEVITRVLMLHPRTKDRDKELASAGWADIRRLAQAEIRQRLADPVERAKMKVGDLNFLAGTAHDKLDKAEGPKEVTLSIKAKIEAMSYDELLKSIPSKQDIIEGDFKIEQQKSANETSAEERRPQIKTLPQSQKDPTDIEITGDNNVSN